MTAPMPETIRDDVQRRGEKLAQRWENANHDIGVLERRIERAVAARDKADAEMEELGKVADLLGMKPKKPNLYSHPINELTGEDW